MRLQQVLANLPGILRARDVAADAEVGAISADSRSVNADTVFVAVRGTTSDGHKFLPLKALALVVEDDSLLPENFLGAVIVVENSRRALEHLARMFFADPARDLFCVGVTGTNGKTTVTYMIEAILTAHAWPTGVMGTIDHHLGKKRWPSALTTPDPVTLQKRLREFVQAGAKAAAFEISSHALDQARAESLPLAVGIFTNFTRDHLDYHGDMQTYFAAKQKMFTKLLGQGTRPAVAILNAADPAVRQTQTREGVMRWLFGPQDADFTFSVIKQDLAGSRFHLRTPVGEVEVDLPCPGLHNIANATAAIAAGVWAGMPLPAAAKALAQFFGAPGRLERVADPKHGRFIFVDYAHTDDALRTVLRSLRGLGAKKIVTVFGCGGDRDRGKRPLMAQAACEFSDVLILTSDNPRTEDPRKILEDIASGVPSAWQGVLKQEIDRHKALAMALQSASEGDVILVAGKGHEDYQIIGTERRVFSDQQSLKQLQTLEV